MKHFKFIFTVTFALVVCFASNVSAQNVNADPVKQEKGQLLEYKPVQRNQRFVEKLLKTKTRGDVIFSEDFEAGSAAWSLDGEWQIGEPGSGPYEGYNGSSNCLATNLDGVYGNGANYWAYPTSPILLPENSDIVLSFWDWFKIESGYDDGMVKITDDGGSTWNTLLSVDGNQEFWAEKTIDLSAYSGEEVYLAFNFTSDGSVTHNGWYIDDITITSEEPTPLSLTILSLNSQNFPFIYANVSVDSLEIGTPHLTQSNFEVFENNLVQSDYFEVLPPNTGSGTRLADIVFLVDNSGSFDVYQNAVEENMYEFIDALIISDIDFSLGLCRFGQNMYGGDPILEDGGQLTQDAPYFRDNVWQRNVVDGGTEPAYDAIYESTLGFNFRPGSQKVFIILADEYPNQGQISFDQALEACLNNSVNLFALTTNESQALNDIAVATDGNYYYILDPFEDILDDISGNIANSYLIKYKSSDPYFNGILRHVDIVANYFGETANDTTSYLPGSVPKIFRTPATIELHEQAWAEGTEFEIEACVLDYVPPFTEEVVLFYKNTSEENYQQAVFTNILDSLWQTTIPGWDVYTPGLDYYITATDGQATSSLPSVNPAEKPFQIAILPNVAPDIVHTPISSIGSANYNMPLQINAEISDNTNELVSTVLFYRKIGQLTYQFIEMINTGGDSFSGEIPAAFVTFDGIDYYLSAKDNFGVASTHGTSDSPHQIIEIDFIPYIAQKLDIINTIQSYERPFSDGFFYQIENDALAFVESVANDTVGGNADPDDLQAVARLALSESVTSEALYGVDSVSVFAVKGVKSVIFMFGVSKITGKLSKWLRHHGLPKLSNKLDNQVNDKLSMAINKKLTALNHALKSKVNPALKDFLTEQQFIHLRKQVGKGTTTAFDEFSGDIAEIGIGQVTGPLFDAGENYFKEYLLFNAYDSFTEPNQQLALNNAQNHNFDSDNFANAKSEVEELQQDLQSANNIAILAGNFLETSQKYLSIALLIASLIGIIIGVLAAGTGVGIIVAILSFISFFIHFGTVVNQGLAIVEAGGAIAYVDGVVPFAFQNPSVDKAFDNSKKTLRLDAPEFNKIYREVVYKTSNQNSTLVGYYQELRNRVQANDSTWASSGMDTLEYYQELAFEEQNRNYSKFLAASDSAQRVIYAYDTLVHRYNGQIVSSYLNSAALDIAAGIYLEGYDEPEIIEKTLQAIDSSIMISNKVIESQATIDLLIANNSIPTPASIGIENVRFAVESSSSNGYILDISATVKRYGDDPVMNAKAIIEMAGEGVSVLNDTLKTVQLILEDEKSVGFSIFSPDSIFTGMIYPYAAPDDDYYPIFPGEIFSFNAEFAVSIQEKEQNMYFVSVVPNPYLLGSQQNDLAISIMPKSDARITVSLLNNEGKLIQQLAENKQVFANSEEVVRWRPAVDVSPGFYIVVITDNRGNKTSHKLILSK